jgi:hypothetical protein
MSVAQYIAKFGHERTWGPEAELTKQGVKRSRSGRNPVQLLGDALLGDDAAGRLFQEYAGATFGRRQLHWSHGMRARLGLGVEQTDEEIVAESLESASVWVSLSVQQWRVILANDLRAEVLNYAACDDWAGFLRACRKIGLPVLDAWYEGNCRDRGLSAFGGCDVDRVG